MGQRHDPNGCELQSLLEITALPLFYTDRTGNEDWVWLVGHHQAGLQIHVVESSQRRAHLTC